MENIKDLLKNNKYGKVIGYCSVAFTDILINQDGEIYGCGCQDWVKKSLGNILDCNSKDNFNKLLDNNSDFKKSIIENNYKFCNAFKCFFLQKNMLKKTLEFPFVQDIGNLKIKQLYLQIDESCNLECPTCRNKKIIHKNNKKTEKIKHILQNINEFLVSEHNEILIRLNGNGELFASHEILPWLLNFNFNKFNKIKFFFHSNGTLLHKHENFLYSISKNLFGFEISIDAATKETYSVVRKNGSWENLLKGLDIIKNLQEDNKDLSFNLSFVVSDKNYHEMENFINFSQKFNANVIFYKINQWNMKNDNFNYLNIFSPSHPNHNDFKKVLKSIKNQNFESNFLYLFNDL